MINRVFLETSVWYRDMARMFSTRTSKKPKQNQKIETRTPMSTLGANIPFVFATSTYTTVPDRSSKNINNKKMYLAGQTDKKRRTRRARLTRGRKGVCKPGRREIIFEKKTPTCVRPRDFQKLHLYTYFYLYMCKGRKRGKNKIKSRETRARDNIRDKSSIQAHVFRVVVIPRVK